MVSLENSKNAKGGFSFDAITPTNDDFVETASNGNFIQNENLPLTVEIEPTFKQIGTTFVIVFQILTVIVLEVGVFVIPILCGENDGKCLQFGGFDIVVFIHAGFWILKYTFDRFYHYHHMKSRRNGYLEFYRITRWLRSIPFLVISASNSLLLVLIKLLNKYCPRSTKCTSADLTEMNFLQIFISVETAILLPTLVYYLVLTIKFNISKKSPDINKEMDRPVFLPSQLKDLGYKDSNYVSNVLENQADMIRYLQERNEKLTQKLFQVTEKSNAANIN